MRFVRRVHVACVCVHLKQDETGIQQTNEQSIGRNRNVRVCIGIAHRARINQLARFDTPCSITTRLFFNLHVYYIVVNCARAHYLAITVFRLTECLVVIRFLYDTFTVNVVKKD